MRAITYLSIFGIISLIACACGFGIVNEDNGPSQHPAPVVTMTPSAVSQENQMPYVQQVEVTRIPPGSAVLSDVTPYPTFARMEMADVEERPEFVQGVAPREYWKVPLDTYDAVPFGAIDAFGIKPFDLGTPTSSSPSYRSSICVRPRTGLLVEAGDEFAPDHEDLVRFMDRMELIVDGESLRITGNRGGTFFWLRETDTLYMENTDYCWHAPLGVGIHSVSFRFTTTSGTNMEYSWYFEIVD